jgi:hypothetical protein
MDKQQGVMKEDNDTCSTGSSLSGIYKNFFKVIFSSKTKGKVCLIVAGSI